MTDNSSVPDSGQRVDYRSLKVHHRITDFQDKLTLRARRKLYSLFEREFALNQGLKVLDVGVTPEDKVEYNNFFEEAYPWKDQITATSVEDASFLIKKYPGLTFVQTDGKTLPFADDEFDVVYSSAVIEHVGDSQCQKDFVEELRRVGKSLFITTPNRWFPIEMHTSLPFLHYLPQRIHQKLLRAFGLHFFASTENLNLLTPKEIRQFLPSDKGYSLVKFKTFGFTSNLVVYG